MTGHLIHFDPVQITTAKLLFFCRFLHSPHGFEQPGIAQQANAHLRPLPLRPVRIDLFGALKRPFVQNFCFHEFPRFYKGIGQVAIGTY